MQRFVAGNELTLLRNGADYFPALIAAIDRAHVSIQLETYIFAADNSGLAVAAALCAAARRGVTVCVLIDGYGSKPYAELALVERLREAGVHIALYRPDLFANVWRRTRARRLHRKLVLIDGIVGFVGGINVIDDLHTPRHIPPRIDFAVRVRGPVLWQFERALSRLWVIVRTSQIPRQLPSLPRLSLSQDPQGVTTARLVTRDNFRNRRSIEAAYLAAIRSARLNVTLANAYFLPGKRIRHALVSAAQRGVRVRLLLQAQTEYPILNWASKALYGQLLEAGVEIYEFTQSFLHAKVACVDDVWSTIGSSNIDPLSLLLAREANLVVRDETFTAALRLDIEKLIETGALQMTSDRWHQRSILTRVGHWMSYGVARMLIAYLAFGAKDYRS